MSQEIRVLTGFHAGARLQLNTRTMSIGAQPDADILINDWSEATMQLAMDENGRVTIGAIDSDAEPILLEDFEPRRFGDVVLCAGPGDAAWPSDVQLMQSLLMPRREPRKYDGAVPDGVHPEDALPLPYSMQKRNTRWTRVGLAAMLIGTASAGIFALTAGQASQAAVRPAAHATLADLKRELARLHESGITIEEHANGFIATGIAPSTADARNTRAALQPLAGNRLRWHVKPADDIARELAESLHEPQVKVRYTGGGRFEVAGNAHSPKAVRDVVDRFCADMAPLAVNIDFHVARTDELAVTGKIDSALAADTVRYVESSDGTKNFVAELSGNTTLH